MEDFYIVILMSAMLVLLAAFSSVLAFRFGAPLLLLFLGIGLLAGTNGFGIEFNDHHLAYSLGSVALAVILFDSGFGTPIHAFKQAAVPAITLASVGVLMTAALFGAASMWLLDFTWLQGMLLGSIVASTDAAAVFFLLRIGGINLRDKVLSTLEVESGTNDPMAIFLTIALVEALASGEGYASLDLSVLWLFLQQMVLGVTFGIIGGMVIVLIASRFDADRGLTPILVLASALLVFSLTGVVGGSGFLAVYVAGIYAGNQKIPATASLKRFQSGMTWLAQIIMFLMLGLLATPSQFPEILLPAIALALFLIFVARPLAVWLSLLPYDYTQQEIGFVAWVGLRGAVSLLLAIMPVMADLKNSTTYFNTAFLIVLISMLFQGWTVKTVARKLGLIIPPRIGAVDKVEMDLPGAANHELLSYRVIKDSPVLRGERIPRWATPSLVIRDGRSMRYQYAGRLRENDLIYIFIAPSNAHLLDQLFASRPPVDEDDTDFFGAFALSPQRPASELDEAYGPGLLNENETSLTIGELMRQRLGGRAGYADRVRLGSIILIVRALDENDHISSIGMSLEAVEPAFSWPIFINFRDILGHIRDRIKKRRLQHSLSQKTEAITLVDETENRG